MIATVLCHVYRVQGDAGGILCEQIRLHRRAGLREHSLLLPRVRKRAMINILLLIFLNLYF